MGSEFRQNSAVPDVIYANDGTKYYPCSYCCRAFAHKRYLTLHMRACVKNEPTDQIQVVRPNPVPHKVKVKKETETIDLTNDAKVNRNKKTVAKNYNNNNNVASIKLEFPHGSNITVRQQVKRHRRNHLIESMKSANSERCKLCAMVFRGRDELIMHAKIEHNQRRNSEKRIFPPEELEYFYTIFLKSNKTTCPVCSKPIGNKLNWKRHLFTHSSVKRFECNICKKTFSRSDHCKYHEKRHKMELAVLMKRGS